MQQFSENITLAEYVASPELSPLPDVFADIFPFYIVLNRDLQVLHVGPMLRRLYPQIKERHYFDQHFRVNRPNMEIDFDRIRAHCQSLFLIECLNNGMLLRGQVIYVDYEDVILFLGSPWITDSEELEKFQLKLSDFAIHDTIGDFLFVLQAQKASIRDIKKMADKLAQQKVEIKKALKQEQELSSLKTRFITTASHEFRTPLSIISSSTGLLEEYDIKLDPTKKVKHWHRIQSAVKHMTTLLEDVLLIYQTDAGKVECNRSKIELVSFCHEIIEQIESSNNAEGRFKFNIYHGDLFSGDLSGEVPNIVVDDNTMMVNVDSKLIRQILTNLLSNAIKYSFPSTEVRFDLSIEQFYLTFSVSDRGIGISAEDQERLFESFHRGTNVSTIPGTGLGLSIVKRCVEIHHGTIEIESEVNVGTTFTVNIPINRIAP